MFLIRLIISFIALFRKPVLPHPEEPINPIATMGNTNLTDIISRWFTEWQVKDTSSWSIELSEQYPYAAWSVEGKIYVRPEWANPGTIAHEAAHISYALLTPEQKQQFEITYNAEMRKSRLMREAYRQHPYIGVGIVESHAEIYRYLGQGMPSVLKSFYPKVI